MENMDVKLENLYHSVDNKENNLISKLQLDSNEETPSYSNSCFQIKKKEQDEIEINFEDLHHSINIKKKNFETEPQIPNGKKKFRYKIFNYKCFQKRFLEIHILTHTGEKPFQCNFCDYNAFYRGHFKRHLYTHTGKNRFIGIFAIINIRKKDVYIVIY